MTVALLAACAGWRLAGLGWTVQATAYPAFADVPAARWTTHHTAHSRRITLAVGPAWVVQGAAHRLARGFSPVVHRELLRANRLRSIVFTVTAVLASLGAA